MLFLYFIVLTAFYACKNDTNNISNRHKTKANITIYKSLGKSKDQYTDKHSRMSSGVEQTSLRRFLADQKIASSWGEKKKRFGASYSTGNKLLLVARHILITGLPKCL